MIYQSLLALSFFNSCVYYTSLNHPVIRINASLLVGVFLVSLFPFTLSVIGYVVGCSPYPYATLESSENIGVFILVYSVGFALALVTLKLFVHKYFSGPEPLSWVEQEHGGQQSQQEQLLVQEALSQSRGRQAQQRAANHDVDDVFDDD